MKEERGVAVKRAVIIGASSGVGRALAREMARRGCVVGATGRREHLLQELHAENPERIFIKSFDVCDSMQAVAKMEELIGEMGGMDIAVISAGTGFVNPELEWEGECDTIDVNVRGFAAMACFAMRYFYSQNRGHLVGISSIAAIRGDADAPAYGASKAFVSMYLDSLRQNARRRGIPVFVTEIQPGFIDTEMAKGEGLFWVATPETAARQILCDIEKKRHHGYISRRWRIIAWLMRITPGRLWYRIMR